MQFYLHPEDDDLSDFTLGLEGITVTRANGETLRVDPGKANLRVVAEHPPVDRMDGDLGAICEVYKQKRDTFVSLSSVQLTAGDVITLYYAQNARTVTMRVEEIEGGRARVR